MMRRIVASFKPHRIGSNRVLGSLEREVMRVLWQKGETSGRNILTEVVQVRKIAYTTLLTVIGRLTKKGFVKRRRAERNFVYSPTFSEKEFKKQVAKEVLEGLVNLSSASTVSAFVDLFPRIGEEKIEELRQLTEQEQGNEKRDPEVNS